MIILKIYTLEKGWHDRDTILLHAAFQILADFMEKEKPGEIIDWSHDAEHRKVWKELNALYKWWTVTRPNYKDPFDGIERPENSENRKEEKWNGRTVIVTSPNRKDPACRKYWREIEKAGQVEQKRQEEDQKNLERLIAVRHYLWT